MSATGVVHQSDPRHPVPGGIDSCIAGILRYAPEDRTLLVIGADRSGASTPQGEVIWLEQAERRFGFLPVTRLGRAGRTGLVPETVRLAVGILRQRRRIAELVDDLQIHRSELGVIARLAMPRVPRVQCIHGDNAEALWRKPRSYWRYLRRLHLVLERSVVRHTTRTFVFSRTGAARIGAVAEGVEYVPNFFDPALVRTRLDPHPSGPHRALWVGRLEPEKDPRLALDALEKFVAAATGRTAMLVGGGSLLEQLQRDRSAVVVAGPMTREEVAREMAQADALVMTSHFEGSPVVMYEALASGTPVVCTDESDPDRTVVEGVNGFRVAGRDPESLAKALEQAMGLSRHRCIESVETMAAPAVVPRLFTAI